MALIVLLVINLLILNLNCIEAAHNEDTAVNSWLPSLRKWCAICEKFIIKMAEACNNFFKALFGSATPLMAPIKQSRRSKKQAELNSFSPQMQSPSRLLTNPPFIPTRPYRDTYEIEEVYIQDLESAVYIILHDHLSQFDKLEGVDVLSSVSYLLWFIYVDFPNYPKVPSAVKMVYDYIYDRPYIERMDLRRVVIEATKRYNIQGGRWVSCGDLAKPENCGLWLLFHMISIHCSIRTNSSRVFGPVPYILQYVFKFNHRMIPGVALKIHNITNQTDHKEATLLLWDYHNEAINRQYPSYHKCPECWNGPPELIRPALYEYLVRVFTNIKFYSS